MPGAGADLSKFVQGDARAISAHCPGLPPLLLEETVSVGPGARKFLQLMFQGAPDWVCPTLPKGAELQTLKFLRDLTLEARAGTHRSCHVNHLGPMVAQLLSFRGQQPGVTQIFPSLHDFQVRACVAHVAYYSFHRYQASTVVPLLHDLHVEGQQITQQAKYKTTVKDGGALVQLRSCGPIFHPFRAQVKLLDKSLDPKLIQGH